MGHKQEAKNYAGKFFFLGVVIFCIVMILLSVFEIL